MFLNDRRQDWIEMNSESISEMNNESIVTFYMTMHNLYVDNL